MCSRFHKRDVFISELLVWGAVLSRGSVRGNQLGGVEGGGGGKKEALNNSKKKKEKQRANIWHLSTERWCPTAEEETEETERLGVWAWGSGGGGDSLAAQRFPDAAAQSWR